MSGQGTEFDIRDALNELEGSWSDALNESTSEFRAGVRSFIIKKWKGVPPDAEKDVSSPRILVTCENREKTPGLVCWLSFNLFPKALWVLKAFFECVLEESDKIPETPAEIIVALDELVKIGATVWIRRTVGEDGRYSDRVVQAPKKREKKSGSEGSAGGGVS